MTVQHYLVVFDRSKGRTVDFTHYDRASDAFAARLHAERIFQDDVHIEVVVLTAQSDDALRRTHGRYFESLADLARRGVTSLGRQRDHALGVA